MIWKDIPDYIGLYQVSDTGLVRSLDRVVTQKNRSGYGDLTRTYKGKLLKPRYDKDGYKKVELNKQGYRPKYVFVHRLVALSFVSGYFDGAVVNHIDGNKANNLKDNLEWCTVKSNNVHAYRTGLKQNNLKVGLNAKSSCYVITTYKGGQVIAETCGVDEFNKFGKSYGLKYSSMLNFFRGKVKHYKGYTFSRRNKDE